jgi:hypothetical protein
MSRGLKMMVAVFGLLALPLLAHDKRLHGGNAVTGESSRPPRMVFS